LVWYRFAKTRAASFRKNLALLFQFFVDLKIPFRNREPAQPLPYFSNGPERCFLYPGVVGEPKIIVGADHDHSLPLTTTSESCGDSSFPEKE